MTLGLGSSAGEPVYLYVVFVACLAGAAALLVGGWLSRRRSGWNAHMQAPVQAPPEQLAYPAEPQRTPVSEPETVAVKKPAGAKKTTTANKTATAKKTTTAKKTAAKKTAARSRARQ